METCKNCENCHSYKGNKKKVFLYDGVCFLISSKPQFVKKTGSCKHWTEKKGENK